MWGHAQAAPKAVILQGKEQLRNFVPSVIGMGAKDAVYLLESKGLKVTLSGVGKVKSQSLPYVNYHQEGTNHQYPSELIIID